MENKEFETQEQEVLESCQCEECDSNEQYDSESSVDERFVQLEIEKEINRIEKEIWLDDEEKQDFVELKEFSDGLKEGAFYAGYFTSLINAGVPIDKAYEMILNDQTCKHNQQMVKIDLEKAKVAQSNVRNDMV